MARRCSTDPFDPLRTTDGRPFARLCRYTLLVAVSASAPAGAASIPALINSGWLVPGMSRAPPGAIGTGGPPTTPAVARMALRPRCESAAACESVGVELFAAEARPHARRDFPHEGFGEEAN